VNINHPDQYHTITKEKGKKMPRFNTESNEYRVTFNELNVHSVPDILKTLQNLFDSVLPDVTKGMRTTHVIFVLYLDDATFIFQEPLRAHVITSLSSSTLRKADVCYIQMYTMVQDELFVGL
jgi:hypothetical protein